MKILDKPRVLNAPRTNILAQIAAIVLLIKLAFSFIVRITNKIRKLYKTDDPGLKEKSKLLSYPNLFATLFNLNNRSLNPLQ